MVDGAQAIDVTDEKVAGAVGESHGEEESATFDFQAPIVGHRNVVARNEDVGTALRAFAHPTELASVIDRYFSSLSSGSACLTLS